MSAVIGFGSALLAIVLTPTLQHYFWRRQRHAELCLRLIEESSKLIAEFSECLPKILDSKQPTEADSNLFHGWQKLSLQIRALFSERTIDRFSKLDELISAYSSHTAERTFKIEEFVRAQSEATKALYEEIGLTGEQLSRVQWWELWHQ